MTNHRETIITVFGKSQVIRTERTGTVKQLEAAHTKAVRAALVETYAAVSDVEKEALKKRLEKRIAELEPKVAYILSPEYRSPEQYALRGEIYAAQRTLADIGKHKFTPAKSEYVDGKPTKVRYVSVIPESVMPYHEYVQDALV
jgi:hypothetical protein